jgi:hypothetical protein
VLHQIEGVTIKLSETKEVVERAALGLAETKDRTSRVESDLASLRAAIADDRRKVEQVRREVVGVKAELSDCCPKVKKDLANLEQEVAKLKGEIRAMRLKLRPLALPAADVVVLRGAKAAAPAWRSSNGALLPQAAAPSPIPAMVKVLARPTPPKPVKQFPPSLKKGKIEVGEEWGRNKKTLDVEIDAREGIIAPGLSGHIAELIAFVSLRGGSRVMGGLSARGLMNVEVQDWSDDFTFIIGDHCYQCRTSVGQFLSPRVCKLRWIDATISELRLEVEDGEELFGSMLEASQGCSIAVDSAHRRTFKGIYAARWNSELYRSVCPELGDEATGENVVDRLPFLSATRCDISTELEFIASHFYGFLHRPDALKAFPVSLLYEIISHGSLRVESEDSLYNLSHKGIETNRKMFGLLEFVRFEYCSTDVMNDFFDLLSEDCYEINASMWGSLRARLVLPNMTKRQFPPSVKKGKIQVSRQEVEIDVPDGIIAHRTRECGGNVHDHSVVNVTSGSFEKETCGANPHSGAYGSCPHSAAKNAADLETNSCFISAFRRKEEDIPHMRNNWVCYDFKERGIVPTHYAIRAFSCDPGDQHLKSWLVETSADEKRWQVVAREEGTKQLNGRWLTGTFPVAGGGECRFIRLVDIGRNHPGTDCLLITAWEIFGSLIE